MSEPQSGIIPEPNSHAIFLILRVRDASANAAAVARTAAAVPVLTDRVAKLDPRAKLTSVVGFGSKFWDAVSPRRRPVGLKPFRALKVATRRAPNTGGDLLLHVAAKRQDLCMDLACKIREQLADRVTVLDEVHGFRYLDSRDLTGFIDGTENPKGVRARSQVALVGADDPYFSGGSFVFTQRYVHDLRSWATLPLREQERTIGRRKRDSQELSARAKPATAHISRVVIEEDGEELEIVRHSYPYGTTSARGLFFIAYNKELETFEKMLARMYGATDDGLHDHLMDYTKAVSGATFFAPSLKVLRALGRG